MAEENYHIDKAIDLFSKLIECRSNFIYTGVQSFLLNYLDNNYTKLCCYCQILKKLIDKVSFEGEIQLSDLYKNRYFKAFAQNKKSYILLQNCKLIFFFRKNTGKF